MDIHPWMQMAANLGGFGVMAYAMFTLHRDTLKEFVKQLSAERALYQDQSQAVRNANADMWKMYMDLKIRQHEQIVAMLVAQDKTMERMEGNQQRIMESFRPKNMKE